MTRYVPDAGDIVWIDLDPTRGREQAGHRPALVITPARFNSRSGLMLCTPLTSRIKGYPFEVPVGSGVALVDQSRFLDWGQRGVRRKERAKPVEVEAVRSKLRKLIG